MGNLCSSKPKKTVKTIKIEREPLLRNVYKRLNRKPIRLKESLHHLKLPSEAKMTIVAPEYTKKADITLKCINTVASLKIESKNYFSYPLYMDLSLVLSSFHLGIYATKKIV